MDARVIDRSAFFHASFDATISKLSREIIPASDAVRFPILTGVIVLGAC